MVAGEGLWVLGYSQFVVASCVKEREKAREEEDIGKGKNWRKDGAKKKKEKVFLKSIITINM